MDLMKFIIAIIILIFAILVVYSITKAIKTSKENKAADETSKQLFLAQIQKECEDKKKKENALQKNTKEDDWPDFDNLFSMNDNMRQNQRDEKAVVNLPAENQQKLRLKDFYKE